MIWLTWRQFRLEVLIGCGLLAVLATLLIKTGIDIAAAFEHTGLAQCLTQPTADSACSHIQESFRNRFGSMESHAGWLNFVPLIFSMLFAAPFVHELEAGTYRLAWTQSITRMTWVTRRLGLLVAASLIAAGAFTLLITWWRGPWDTLDGSIQPNSAFDFEGIVPLGYAVFAVALIIVLGTVVRRTIPALGLAIPIFLATRLGLQTYLRPHLLSALTTVRTGSQGPRRGDWILSRAWLDSHGRTVPDDRVLQICAPLKTAGRLSSLSKDQFASCLTLHHWSDATVFQPANRFWTFQIMETAVYAGIAAILLAVAVVWITRRYQ